MNQYNLYRKLNIKTIIIILSFIMITMTACNNDNNKPENNDFSDIEQAVQEAEITRDKLDEDYDQAVLNYESNNLDIALKEFKALIAEDNENGLYYYAYGNVYLKKREYDNALEQYDQTIKYLPKFIEAYNNATGICMVLGQFDKAITYIEKAIEIEPNNTDLQFKQGQLYFATERYEESIIVLESIENKDSNPEIYRFLGLAKSNLQQIEESISNLNKYIDLAPKESVYVEGIQEIINTLKQQQS